MSLVSGRRTHYCHRQYLRGFSICILLTTAFLIKALETTEAKLMREFETFGRIKRVRMPIRGDTKLPCGYAFIEFEKEKEMKEAYKAGDGRRIDGKRISVDVERGRTIPNWLPKR